MMIIKVSRYSSMKTKEERFLLDFYSTLSDSPIRLSGPKSENNEFENHASINPRQGKSWKICVRKKIGSFSNFK